MTQVCQRYARTFGKFKFHFHYESDPTFDTLARFVCSKNACTPKMEKIARSIFNLTNSLRQQKLVIIVYACNLPMLGLLTTILGTLMYYDKSSSKQKLQVCKQRQTASGNKNLYLLFIALTSLSWVLLQPNLVH